MKIIDEIFISQDLPCKLGNSSLTKWKIPANPCSDIPLCSKAMMSQHKHFTENPLIYTFINYLQPIRCDVYKNRNQKLTST